MDRTLRITLAQFGNNIFSLTILLFTFGIGFSALYVSMGDKNLGIALPK